MTLEREVERPSASTAQNPTSVPQVERIATKLPPFWDDMPEIWFAQAEAEFEVSQITRERTRYSYLIGALPKQTLAKVLDVIKAPHEKTPYTHLKEKVLSRLSTSEEAGLSKLLYHVEMGDRSPSELYRHMVQLAGGSADISATLIQKL